MWSAECRQHGQPVVKPLCATTSSSCLHGLPLFNSVFWNSAINTRVFDIRLNHVLKLSCPSIIHSWGIYCKKSPSLKPKAQSISAHNKMFLLLLLFATRLEYHRINENMMAVKKIDVKRIWYTIDFSCRHGAFCVVAGLHGRRTVIRG